MIYVISIYRCGTLNETYNIIHKYVPRVKLRVIHIHTLAHTISPSFTYMRPNRFTWQKLKIKKSLAKINKSTKHMI